MNMEIDKSVNNVTISRTMIESLLGVIQSKNIRNLENVLDMITKNLMFDDPGLFDVKLIAEPHERQMQQTVNIWLINQMLHLLLQPECERLATNVLNLQTEMLAASYLKQPWFFEKLLLIYIEFTAILANATAISSNQPFITKLFTIDNINLNAIVENCEFSKIEITTERQQLNLAVNNIKLLTNVIPLIDQINENLLRKATESVMSAFNRSTPHIKVECLQYFVRTWKQHRCLNRENFQLLVGYILEGIEKIIQVLKPPQVIQLLVIERDNFLINSGKWFNEFDASIDAVTEHLITKNLNTFLSLIKVLDKIENIKMVQFQCSLFKFIKKLLKKCGTQQHIMRIQSHISSNELNGPSLILLEFFILNNLTKFNEAEILGYGLFNELMGKCLTLIKDSLYEEEIEQNLTLMKSIIEMANTIDHDFQHWHQNQHIKNQCQLCQTTSSITTTINIGTINIIMKTISPLASLQVDEFTKRFVDILTQHRYLKSPHIPQITGIAIQLLCLGSVQQFTENTKLSLLKITLATLCNRSESSLKHVHSIFSNSILTKDTLFDPARLVDNLESFININIMGMSLDNKNFIQEHILNVTENVNILWKIRLKFLLADSHFNRDLCAFLFERNMNENNSNLIAKSHLIKATVCALSTVVYEVRSRTKTHYYDQLICHQCFNETLFQRNDCVISKYTIQNPDTFTSNMDSIFKLFKCTNTEVRLNMIQWIAGLANHCPNIICQNDNLTYWTDLFLDEDTNILNSLASNIEAILEGIENTNIDRATKNLIILDCLKKLSQQIRKSIDDKHEQRQKCLLRILTKIATTSGFKLNDELLLNCIRCTCVFIMVVNSYVARHSAQAIEDMCVANGVSARDLLNWHSQTMLKHLVTLAVITFMRYGYGLEKSFFIVSTAFNYKNARDFLSNNFPTIIGMILAWRIKHTECQELLDEICTLINYDASTIFTKSFLSIYTYVHFNESSSIKDQCIKFICATTKKTVCQHLKQDIRFMAVQNARPANNGASFWPPI